MGPVGHTGIKLMLKTGLRATRELGKATQTFMSIMRQQPLSLSLVVMNLILLGFLFYSNSVQLNQRRDTVELIVAWQRDADKLMADCVSKEVMQAIIEALERDRELYRSLLQQSK